MAEVVQVRLREAGKTSCFDMTGLRLKVGNYVIVGADRGLDYGQVLSGPEVVSELEIEEPLKKVLRQATREDLAQIRENERRAKDIFNIGIEKIEKHKLNMKLVEVEYSFDRSKIIFYFTADGRVDFRELVKDLAQIFKTRIELRQIGVRDEAKMLGGFGPCGRPLCCATFLKDFEPVTIRMAKEQNLSLNPAKISGLCGRLMCCLSFECKVYKELLKGLPREGQIINTREGKGRVVGVNPLNRSVLVEIGDRQIEVSYKKE